MGVELRCGVAFDRASGVVLELGCNEFPGCFGGVVASNPGLRVPLQLSDSGGDGGGVCFPNPFITSHQSRERNRFGR